MKNKFLVFFCLFILLPACKKKTNTRLAKNYYEQSMLEIEDKNYTKAMQLINKSIEIAPTAQALAIKASLAYQNKDYNESISLFKQIIKDNNASSTIKADVANNLACTYLAMGNFDEAKK